MFQIAPPAPVQFDGIVGDVFFRPWLLGELGSLYKHLEGIGNPETTVECVKAVLVASLCGPQGERLAPELIDQIPLPTAMEMVRHAVELNKLSPNSQDATKKNSSAPMNEPSSNSP
jgi:hypothetical protein